MAYTIDSFAAECKKILSAEPGRSGREKVLAAVRDLLKDQAFIARHLTDDTPEREILYEDPDLGFTVLAHVNRDAKSSPPHDHGPTWAIYGQAAGETLMTDWACVERPADGKPGKVKFVKNYSLTPGMAYLYNEGDLHSPRREGPTRLIRIEGVNVLKIRRFPYQAIEEAVAAE
jgi:predicted metal-dependent enzyme (double-stranded beta helix superfamily)